MTPTVIKFFHLLCGTTLFGIIIANFFYIARAFYGRNQSVFDYTIRASYFGDAAIVLCLLVQAASSIPLMHSGHFTFHVPWIVVAYIALGSLTLLWLTGFLLKILCFNRLTVSVNALHGFYCLNIAMILILCVIVHDAVEKSTWLQPLFWK